MSYRDDDRYERRDRDDRGGGYRGGDDRGGGSARDPPTGCSLLIRNLANDAT
jgi:hypothetical protein